MSKFVQSRLGNICKVTNGRAYKQSELLDFGKYKVLRVGNFFTNNDWYYSNLELEQDKYCDFGDLLYAWSASFGPRIWKGDKTIYHYHIWKLDVNSSIIIKPYLYYFLMNRTKSFMSSTHGSIMLHLTKSFFEDLIVQYPSQLQTQKAIAKVLSDLDSKIELNNRINRELEAMAKTLYDYWFVQFDFPDKNGKPYKSSGGKMVYNKELKREIPEGWEVGIINDFIKIERGISYKSSEIKIPGKPMVNLNSFYLNGEYKVEGIKYFSGSYKKNKTCKNGDLLIAVTDVTRNADIIGKSILLPNIFENEITFSMDVAKITPTEKLDVYFLNMLFNSQPYHDYIKQFASGTLVLHLDLRALNFYKLAIPPTNLLKKFSNFKASIEKKKSNIIKENQQLTTLRDWLLPMLMNGQVTVQQAETKVKSLINETASMVAEPEVNYNKKPLLQGEEDRAFFKRKMLATHIINKSLDDNKFGKVKFEKLLFLADYYALQRNLGQKYIKKPAGPYDNRFTYGFFKQVYNEEWFEFKKQGNLARIIAGKNHYKSIKNYNYFSEEELNKINKLIEIFKKSNYEKAEIIATLYAVWNNRIIENKPVTDELLIQDFINWDKQKIKYKDRLPDAIKWMKENNFVPNGWGKIIK